MTKPATIPETVALPLADSVGLAHALITHMANHGSCRVLFLKGPSTVKLGLVDSRSSADVDVLVAQSEFDMLVNALQQRGWHRRPDSTAPRFYPLHSCSLWHPLWPCDIDVHFRYPGIFADVDRAFDHVWSRRQIVTVDGNDVTTLCKADMCIILGLHSLRDPTRTRSTSDLEAIYSALSSDSDLLRDFLDSARRLRALTPLAPLLLRLGLEKPTSELSPGELDSWRLLSASPATSTAFHWWIAFTRSSPLTWPLLFKSLAQELVRRAKSSSEPSPNAIGANPHRTQSPILRRAFAAVHDVRLASKRYKALVAGSRSPSSDTVAAYDRAGKSLPE